MIYTFEQNRTLEDQHKKEIINILEKHLSGVIIEPTSNIADWKLLTDIRLNGFPCATRLYRYKLKGWRDVTLRSKSRRGGETELTKVLRGLGKWYDWNWLTSENKIGDWVLVDLDLIRNMWIGRPERENADGSAFVSMPLDYILKFVQIGSLNGEKIGRI